MPTTGIPPVTDRAAATAPPPPGGTGPGSRDDRYPPRPGGPSRPASRATPPALVVLALLPALACGLATSPAAWAAAAPEAEQADEVPLYLQDPYDQITLDEHNDFAVLKVYPIKLPEGGIPEHPRPSDGIVIRLLGEPETPYEVKWHAIDELMLFEDLVLAEANRKVIDGKLAEAWDYFAFLLEEYPNTRGLEESIQNYLYREASQLAREGEFAGSLAVLRELYGRNAEYDPLPRATGSMTNKLVTQYVESGNYPAARRLIRELAQMFPQHAVVQQWEETWRGEAAALLKQAQEAGQQDDYRQADRLLRRVMQVWPELPGAKEYAEVVHRRFPRVVVAVTQPATAPEPGRIHDWAARRASRLVHRTITEFRGPGTDGGRYGSPLGEIEIQELGLRVAIRLAPDRRWSEGDAVLTGYDLARRLLAMTNPDDPAYRGLWADLLAEVRVEDIFTVYADLTRPHVRPEALLVTTALPYTEPGLLDHPHLSNGPYRIESAEQTAVVYAPNPQYFATESGQPEEIVEQYFPKGLDAVRALQRHAVDVIDRINPWEKKKVDSLRSVRVDRYAMPLLHVLIPNRQRPLVSRVAFRRALVYGIHREGILANLLGEASREGCQVISGPFSPGTSADDPLDYAYEHTITPRRYDPRLALALAKVVFQEYSDSMAEKGEPVQAMPTLVLAHPPHEIARLVCKSIKKNLELLEIPIQLRELPPGADAVIPEDVDLMFAELAMWEPVVDARPVLDFDGMSRGASPAMSLALRELEKASEWVEVAQKLREIHRIAFDDVAVIPLWQLTSHFAYHEGLHGISPQPVSLYQDVEHWRIEFFYPTESK